MRRRWPQLAGWSWIASGVVVWLGELAAAVAWPRPYSLRDNTISDLGAAGCGAVVDAGVERFVCSPWNAAFGAGVIASGAFLTVGATILLFRGASGTPVRSAMVVLVLTGVLVVGVGVAPADAAPQLHALAVIGQAVGHWAGMALLLADGRWPRPINGICLAVSLAGIALFLSPPAVAAIGLGYSERLAFDTYALWSILLGLWLAVRKPELLLRPRS